MDLSGGRLSAVVAIWKQRKATISTRFDGQSMLPTLSSAHELEVHCGDLPEPGDVVAYERDDQIVVHRALIMDRGFLLSRGDGSVVPDPPVPLERVIGVVRSARLAGEIQSLAPPNRSILRSWPDRITALLLRVDPRLAASFVRLLWLLRRTGLKLGVIRDTRQS